MRIALIQQHATDDRDENLSRAVEATRQAAREGASLVAFASLASGIAAGGASGETGSDAPSAVGDLLSRPSLLPDPDGRRARLAEKGLAFEAVYTADWLANVRGGVARKRGFLGNLDATLTWQTEPSLGRDLGTFFLYGLWNHGERPSRWIGDLQVVDNIEAPDSAKLFEAWWQRALLDGRASILLGLYDVNSEFYAIDSAEIFVHSSFGMGAALGASGVNGPSTFPTAGLGARLKVEPIEGFEFQAAVVEGPVADPW